MQNTSEELSAIFGQLESLSVRDLRQIRKQADTLISSKENAEKREALEEIQLLIEQKGLSGDEIRLVLFPTKFIHPDDPTKAWSGKGKKAVWLQTEIDEGRRAEDFLNPAWKEARPD